MRRAVGIVSALSLVVACSSGDGGGEATETTTSTTAPATYEPVYASGPCDDDVPDDPRVECGVLTVPIDRTDPDAGDAEIAVAVLRSADPDPLPDPIVYFEGGPGFAARWVIEDFMAVELGGRRDVIVFDQRGTGASTPSLDCPENIEAVFTVLGAAAPAEDERTTVLDALAECRARLIADGIDIDAVDTPTTADDAEDLRIAMGIDEWNVFGVSYGTTVALEVLRRHPDAVRSAVLDSVYPMDIANDARRSAENATRVFDLFFDGCRADPGCAAAYPTLEQDFAALIAEWNADPTSALIGYEGENVELLLTGDDLVAGTWNALYDTSLIPVLPSLVQPLRELAPGTEGIISELASDGVNQLIDVAEGVAIGVDCADRQRLGIADHDEVVAEYPMLRGLLALSIADGCDVWDVESVDASANEPVEADVPTLLLSGEYDPVTPPADARRAAISLPRSTHVIFPGMGHGEVLSHDCPRSIFDAFLAAPGDDVSIACVEEMGPPRWILPG